MSHWSAAGKLIKAVRADVVVNLGDWSDANCLSSYARPREKETKRIRAEIDRVGQMAERIQHGWGRFKPRLVVTAGNHDGGADDVGSRMYRYVEKYPELDGELRNYLDPAQDLGWEVYPFLQPVDVYGVRYCHLFSFSSVSGRSSSHGKKFGSSSAEKQILAVGMSCTAGHRPGLSYSDGQSRGVVAQGLIAGSFYSHSEDYQTVQGNPYWRGLIIKRMDGHGVYSPEFVSMKRLMKEYHRGR